jgi:hypothetical protein
MLGIPMKHRAPRVDILYSTAADGAPDEKSSTLRKKLMPLSIEIKTHWGECPEIPEISKAIARGLLEETSAA